MYLKRESELCLLKDINKKWRKAFPCCIWLKKTEGRRNYRGWRLMCIGYVQNLNSYFALTFAEDVNHVAADVRGNRVGVW